MCLCVLASLRAAALQAVKQEVVLSHQQKVTRLYRASLRLLDSWAFDKDLFNEEATKIRAEFNAAKSLPADDGCAGGRERGDGAGG